MELTSSSPHPRKQSVYLEYNIHTSWLKTVLTESTPVMTFWCIISSRKFNPAKPQSNFVISDTPSGTIKTLIMTSTFYIFQIAAAFEVLILTQLSDFQLRYSK